jgi:hypothetical protein
MRTREFYADADGFVGRARVWRRETFVQLGNLPARAGTTIEALHGMLVEGGYLHSMKLLIERASEPEPGQPTGPGSPAPGRRPRAGAGSRAKGSGTFVTSIKRLGLILLGWDFQR